MGGRLVGVSFRNIYEYTIHIIFPSITSHIKIVMYLPQLKKGHRQTSDWRVEYFKNI
jgi:hypothetical protein